ncbi:unnamed protein product, partial [Darwinula stevensoni]
MSGAVRFLYEKVLRRTSTFAFAVVVSAVFFERAVDMGCDAIFDNINKGRRTSPRSGGGATPYRTPPTSKRPPTDRDKGVEARLESGQ